MKKIGFATPRATLIRFCFRSHPIFSVSPSMESNIIPKSEHLTLPIAVVILGKNTLDVYSALTVYGCLQERGTSWLISISGPCYITSLVLLSIYSVAYIWLRSLALLVISAFGRSEWSMKQRSPQATW